MIRKCEFNGENLKACSENDWDCAMCEHMKEEDMFLNGKQIKEKL